MLDRLKTTLSKVEMRIKMKIYLLDINSDMTDAWQKYFVFNNIEIINEDFATFMGIILILKRLYHLLIH